MALWKRNKKRPKRHTVGDKGQPKAVFSYYSSRYENGSGEKRKDTTKHSKIVNVLRHVPIFIASGAIVLSIGYLLTLNINPKVVPLSSGSTSKLLRGSAEYTKYAHELLAASLLNRTKITIDANGFEAAMKKHFPELSDVVVILPIMGRRPIVQLQAATPALILQVTNGESYLIDVNGRAIMLSSSLNDVKSLELSTVLDQSGLSVEIGKGILTTSDVSFMATVISQLKVKNIYIESMTLPTIASELHVRVTGQAYYIKFDLHGNARLQLGAYLALKQKLDNDHITPREYIDVRVEEKVYYK